MDVDCHRRDATREIEESSSSSATVSPTNSDDSPASSSADSLPFSSASTGYSSAGDSSSADSSFNVSAVTADYNASVAEEGDDGEAEEAEEEETVQLRQHQPVFPSKGKKQIPRKVRPRLSNDLFSPTRGIFDDYDESSGDSGHVIANERELFGGECGAHLKGFDDCVETDIVEVEEVPNESSSVFPPPASAWDADDGVGDERVSYVGTGGEIWMEGEKCDSCDEVVEEEEEEEFDSGMDGYVTAKGNLATVKPGAIKECEHKQQKPHKSSKKEKGGDGKKEKGGKSGGGGKRDKSFAKSSSQQSKHKTTSLKTSNSTHPSKTKESANQSHRHHQHHHKHHHESKKNTASEKSSHAMPPQSAASTVASHQRQPSASKPSTLPPHSDRPSLLPGGQTLNKENLASLVKEFNKRSKGLSLNILEDGVTVRGFIRVHLDLMRPGKRLQFGHFLTSSFKTFFTTVDIE